MALDPTIAEQLKTLIAGGVGGEDIGLAALKQAAQMAGGEFKELMSLFKELGAPAEVARSTFRDMGFSIKGTSREIEEFKKAILDLSEGITKMKVRVVEGTDSYEKLKKVAQETGLVLDVMSKETLEKMKEQYKSLTNTIKELGDQATPDLIRSQQMLKRELEAVGQEVEQTTTRAISKIPREIKSTIATEIGGDVPGGFETWAKFGIWGLILYGTIGFAQRFRPEAASVLAEQTRVAGTGFAALNAQINEVKNTLQSMHVAWLNILDEKQLASALQAAVNLTGQVGAAARELADASLEADAFFGLRWGQTLDRLVNLNIKFGMSHKELLEDMRRIVSVFSEAHQNVRIYSNTIFEMQNRLGPLAYDLTRIGTQLSVFSNLSREAGGGLEQGRAALENMYTFVQRVGPAWQIALAGGAGVGGTGLEQWWQMQRWLAGFGGAEFQRAVPQMFANLLQRFGFVENTLQATFGLSQMGISPQLLVIAQEALKDIRKRGVPEERIYEELTKELSASKEFQKASKEQLVDLGALIKDTLQQQVPLIQQALNAVIELLQGLFNLIAALVNAMVGFFFAMDPRSKVTFSEVGNWLKNQMSEIWTSQIKPAGKELGETGLALFSSIFSSPWMDIEGGGGGGGGERGRIILSSEQVRGILGLKKVEDAERILIDQEGKVFYTGGYSESIESVIERKLYEEQPLLKKFKANIKYESGKVIIEVDEKAVDYVAGRISQSLLPEKASPTDQ